MSDTKISWTTKTWNPVTGCTRVSAGCDHCYAFDLHDRRYAQNRKASANEQALPWPVQYNVPFSRVQLFPERLLEPLRWRKPQKVFLSMGDLFHEDVPDEFIDRVFATAALTPQHTYQFLTKRPERMREYVSASTALRVAVLHDAGPGDHPYGIRWPLPNVWLGTSCEDQATADERIPHLLATPAAVRFVSCEPLLGPMDIADYMHDSTCVRNEEIPFCICSEPREVSLDWVIVGGESGPRARPMELEWAISLRDQCKAAQVAVWMKQQSSRKSEKRFPADIEVREFPV